MRSGDVDRVTQDASARNLEATAGLVAAGKQREVQVRSTSLFGSGRKTTRLSDDGGRRVSLKGSVQGLCVSDARRKDRMQA